MTLHQKTPPVEQKFDKVPTIDPIIHLTADEQSKGNITNEENSYEDITAESTKASDKEQDTQKEKLEDLFIMTDNKQEKLKEMITNAVSSAVTSLTKRINDLESKNEELTTKIKELSELINSQNIQGDIKQTTEKTLEHNLEDKIREIRKDTYQKIEQLTEQKIQSIQIERDDINTKFENYKVKVKSDLSLNKTLTEQKINDLSFDLQKVTQEINQLKRANDSKNDKIKNIEETNKQLFQSVHKSEESTAKMVQEQINKIEIETINNDKIQKAVFDFMEQQSKVPITDQQSNRNHNNSIHKDNQVDKSDTPPRFREEKQIKCDIVVLIDSNGKYLQKNKLFPNENVYMIRCPTIEKASQILHNPNIYGQHTIILHTGINNTEYNSAEDITENLTQLLSFCKETYTNTKIYLSGLTPRKDELNMAVIRTNQLIRKELESERCKGIGFIDHSNLDKGLCEFFYSHGSK